MFDATHSSAGRPWSDTCAMAQTEYEAGFLLPQLMGALASESGSDKSKPRDYCSFFLKLCASLTRVLKLR